MGRDYAKNFILVAAREHIWRVGYRTVCINLFQQPKSGVKHQFWLVLRQIHKLQNAATPPMIRLAHEISSLQKFVKRIKFLAFVAG